MGSSIDHLTEARNTITISTNFAPSNAEEQRRYEEGMAVGLAEVQIAGTCSIRPSYLTRDLLDVVEARKGLHKIMRLLGKVPNYTAFTPRVMETFISAGERAALLSGAKEFIEISRLEHTADDAVLSAMLAYYGNNDAAFTAGLLDGWTKEIARCPRMQFSHEGLLELGVRVKS